MKIKFSGLALLLACLFATGAFAQKGKMTPLEYNDKLAAITDSLYDLGVAWGTDFQTISASGKDFSKLAGSRKKMAAFALRKIEEIRKHPTYGKGAEGLKSAMLSFLAFERDMINNAFAPMEKLNSSSSQAEIDEAIKKLTAEAEKEGEELKKVGTAQEEFGKQNGFAIESESQEE